MQSKFQPVQARLVPKGGVIISSGPEEVRGPNISADREAPKIDSIGTAMVVKAADEPEYQYISSNSGNHTFRKNTPKGNSFEYLLSSAWSEGAVYNNPRDFTDYIHANQPGVRKSRAGQVYPNTEKGVIIQCPPNCLI